MSRIFEFIELEKLLDKTEKIIIEPKYDGFYVELHVKNGMATGITRQGAKRFEKKCNLTDGIYYGEWCFGTEWSKKYKDGKWYDHVVLYDYKNDERHYNCRLILLKSFIDEVINNEKNDWIHITEYVEVIKLRDEIEGDIKSWKKFYEEGTDQFEGIVIRDARSTDYICSRLKRTFTMDYVIMGYEMSTAKKYKKLGWIKNILCGLFIENELKQVVKVGSMTEEWRKIFSRKKKEFIGQVIEVKGFQIFKSGALRHPSFLRVRKDKDAMECKWEVKK